MNRYLKLMRTKHYVKNLAALAAPLCGGQIFERNIFFASSIGFIVFCLISSAVYIINDVCDREKDRLHPTKRERPIASGAVSVKNALLLAAFLTLGAFGLDLLQENATTFGLLALYLALNLAYSFGLKREPLLDVSILVAGYVVRIEYGAAATNVPISNWLFLTVVALAFFFAFGKRRNELKRLGTDGATRPSLKAYSFGFLDKNMYLCLTLANVFYALWCIDEKTTARYGAGTVFTVPIVLLITMKYSMNVEGDSDGDPVETLSRDKVLSFLILAYLATMFFLLYSRRF